MPTGAAPPVLGAQPASLVPPGGGPLPAWSGGGSWPGGSSWPGTSSHQPAQAAPAGFDPEMMGQFMQMMMGQMAGQQQQAPTSKPRGGGGKADSATSRGRASAAGQESSRSPSPHRRRLRTHASDGSANGGDGGRRREADDEKKLSNKYKFLGMLWKHGEMAITPKPFRVSLCMACDSEKFQKVPLMLLQDEQVDLLCYNIGGIPPDMKVSDFGTTRREKSGTQAKSPALKEKDDQPLPGVAEVTPPGSAKELSSYSGETKKAKEHRTNQKSTAGQQNLDESFARAKGSEL